MAHHIGIWIDHKKALIVSVSSESVSATTLESGIGPHARYSARAAYPTPNGSTGGGGERHYEGRFDEHLARYYDEVINTLGPVDRLLVLGPGEAKLQLKARLTESMTLADNLIDLETADKMTDPQIIARVKSYFGFDHALA